MLWLSIFVSVFLVVGYEHCGVYDRQCVPCVVYCNLEEVSCLMSLKARREGSDKKEDIEIWIDKTKCFLGFARFWRIELRIN